MDSMLIVVKPFGTYFVGDMITDTGKARELLASENAHDVVRVPYNREALVPVRSGSESNDSIRDEEV